MDPSAPTFHGSHFQYAKVDDLFIANTDALRDYDLSPVHVHTDSHFSSDHYPISIEIFSYTEPQPDDVERFTLSEDRREKWSEVISPILKQLSN